MTSTGRISLPSWIRKSTSALEFEVRSGIYRARWERRRARGKASGSLQQPTRHIYDAGGQPLAQQIREAESKIEEIIGLNYERFLRSALLAQGEFARFLKAKADERAELLESLTGTAVYSALGQKAHEEAKRREDAIEMKEAGLRQIPVLPDPERAELEAQCERETTRRSQLEKEIQDGAKIEAGIRDFQAARGEEKSASAALKAIEGDRSHALADLERLRWHQLTLPFSDDLTRLDLAETASKSVTQKRQQAEAKDKASTEAAGKANAILHASIRNALAILEDDVRDQTANADKQGKIAAEARAWLEENRSDAVLSDQVVELVTAIGDLQKARSDFGGAWEAWKSAAIGILAPEDCAPLEGAESRDEVQFAGALDTVLLAARKTSGLLEKDLEEAKRQVGLRDDHLKKAMLVAKLASTHSRGGNGKASFPLFTLIAISQGIIGETIARGLFRNASEEERLACQCGGFGVMRSHAYINSARPAQKSHPGKSPRGKVSGSAPEMGNPTGLRPHVFKSPRQSACWDARTRWSKKCRTPRVNDGCAPKGPDAIPPLSKTPNASGFLSQSRMGSWSTDGTSRACNPCRGPKVTNASRNRFRGDALEVRRMKFEG